MGEISDFLISTMDVRNRLLLAFKQRGLAELFVLFIDTLPLHERGL